MPITGWMDQARCRDYDPEVFFVKGAAESRPAQRVCQRCEVRELCLEYALEQRIDFGIWGGLTERQRRRLLRRQGLEPAATVSAAAAV